VTPAERGWLAAPDGPLHRPTDAYRSACGERLTTRTGVPASLLQCLVHGVPVCVRCYIDGATRRRP
jgi:hypothetical protein